jgi:hypothetical protein
MEWDSSLSLKERLRATWVETIHHEQQVGFLARDAFTEYREVSVNPDGDEAAKVIEGLERYVQHDVGCSANDLDPLDHSPCTCGLRSFYNPFGRKAP